MQHEQTIELLLQLLRRPMPTEQEEHLLPEMDIESWQYLVNVAINQRVAPLLYRRLREHNRLESVPTEIQPKLQQRYYGQGMRNMRLYHDLKVVQTALQVEQIPVIVLKGAFLAAEVYEQIAVPTSAKIYLGYARRIIDLLKRYSRVGWLRLRGNSALVQVTKQNRFFLILLEPSRRA